MAIGSTSPGGPIGLPLSMAIEAPVAAPAAPPPDAAWLQELLAAAAQLSPADEPQAPVLPPARDDLSGDQLALILAALDSKIKDAQARTAKEGIESLRQRTDSANQRMAAQMQEVASKLSEVSDKQKALKVLAWIAKVAAVVGAIAGIAAGVALLVASQGSAAPLAIPLIAIASVGLVAATVDLASQINQEVHPEAKPFSVGSLIGDGLIAGMDGLGLQGAGRVAASAGGVWLGLFLMQPDLAGQMAGEAGKAGGLDEDKAATLRMVVEGVAVAVTIGFMLALSLASFGSGAASAAGSAVTAGAKAVDAGAKVVSTASKAASAAAKAAQVAAALQAVVSIVQGSTGVGRGAVGIEVAGLTKDADEARAMARRIDALLSQLQAQSEEQTARLKDILEALDAGMAQFSQMIAAAGDQRANQVKNLVRG